MVIETMPLTENTDDNREESEKTGDFVENGINNSSSVIVKELGDSELRNKIDKEAINGLKDNISEVGTNDEDKIQKNEKKKNKSKVRKRITIAESDSEDDVENKDPDDISDKLNDFSSTIENETSINKNRKRIAMLESDSDDDLNDSLIIDESVKSVKAMNSDSEDENIELGGKKSRKIPNSDDESDPTPHNKSFSDEKPIGESTIYTTNSKGELVVENPTFKNSSNWAALCDSDSSGGEDNANSDKEENSGSEKGSISEDEIIKPMPYKKKKKGKSEDEPKQMTPKEAVELRKEIQSESQRMTRETRVSLPYHRPKSFTLKEFLARRPKFASAVPLTAKTPSSLAIKMSADQLEIISKNLAERHKEVKEFYKSESESDGNDDPDDKDYVPPESDKTIDDKRLEAPDKEPQSENAPGIEEIRENIGESAENPEENAEERAGNPEKNTEESSENLEEITEESTGNPEESTEESSEIPVGNTGETGTTKINIISEYIFNKAPRDEEIPTNQIENDVTMNEGDTDNKLNNREEKNDEGNENEVADPPSSITDYAFNIDDLEEQSERILDKETEEKFGYGELDKEIENYGKTKSKTELLKERLSNVQPRLSGGPDRVINLDNVIRPDQVSKLMKRFATHVAKKTPHKERVKLNIVSVENGGEIHKETVAMHVDDEEDLTIEEKPGVRLQRLRNELQSQMARRRSEIWAQRANKDVIIEEKDPYDGEKSECGMLDDDEEEEMSETSEEEEEEEVEEEKLQPKSAFVDDEAAESEKEEDGDDSEADGEDEDNPEADGDDEDDPEADDEVEDENEREDEDKENKDDGVPFKKPLRRIIKGFADDSDEDEDFKIVDGIDEKLNKSNDDSNTQDDYIRPYQIQVQNKTPIKNASDLKFLTPVSYITGIQNLATSATKSPMNVPSPLKQADWHTELQKRLFADSIITDSQAEAMEALCSEKFTESQQNATQTKSTNTPSEIPATAPPSTQDLLNICSGTFDEPTSEFGSTLPPSTQDLLNVCSGKFTGVSQVTETASSTIIHHLKAVEEVKTLGEDQDMLISQLLNEEEMEAFKKKFDSPVLTHSQKIVQEPEEVATGGGIIDSDEDEDGLEVKKKRKNQKKLQFSDDSSDEEEEEKIELYDEFEENEDEERPAEEINYDSEENEVEYAQEQEKQKIKMTDFFEDEAELSESEWGSADEDEKDLDALEFEQGDTEKFDEKQMKADLERIHMRRMLDDDTREVKLLQEMLLDDGELHGTGRQRQFRWKNMDSTELGDEARQDSDDEERLDDDESEEQWRRKRHEREMFLKEKNSQEDCDLLSGSEILKIGHKVIQRSQNSQVSADKTDVDGSPSVKRTFTLTHKRGSFLSRGDQVLQRVAEYNKISTTTVGAGKGAKNSKNFLFQTVVTDEVTAATSILNLKRKGTDGTPKVIKKLRLSDNFSPALNRKKRSEKLIKAKLFGVS